jgi:NAD(P)-dependent dehydrogenase (short-subunit alcohol dehydrogenase family)
MAIRMSAFAGRTVVVTGGARGIGDAIVQSFLEQDANCVSLDVVGPEEAREGVRYLEADISDSESVAQAFGQLDRCDVLINNAGIQRVGLTGQLSEDHWRAVVGTNLTGAFLCNSCAVPMMRSKGSGAIVHVASTAAFIGLPGRGPYSAAKAGLLALTRVMAVELAAAGVRVNAVAPGFTRTKFVEQGIADGSLSEGSMLARVPLGRLADPGEIARVVRFLASDDASYVTGQVLIADGGWTIQGIGEAPAWLVAESQAKPD